MRDALKVTSWSWIKNLFPFEVRNVEVLANGAEIVFIFLRLQLSPRVSYLRAFKLLHLEKRLCLFDFFPVLAKEDIMSQRLRANTRAAEPNEY